MRIRTNPVFAQPLPRRDAARPGSHAGGRNALRAGITAGDGSPPCPRAGPSPALGRRVRRVSLGDARQQRCFAGERAPPFPGSDGHKTFSDLPSFVDVLLDRQHYSAASFICPASDLDRPSSYEMNLNFVGRPLSEGPADAILASEGGSSAYCHDKSTEGIGHGSTTKHLFRRDSPSPPVTLLLVFT